MSGAGLMDFLIVLVGLAIVGAMIFAAIEFVATDERFKKIARFAVGGVIVLAFLYAVKGVLFGGGGGVGITLVGLIEFAIGVIILLVVWYVIVLALDWLATVFPPIGPLKDAIKFVVSALVLVVLLLLAANLLFGVSIGGGGAPFRLEHRGQLPAAVQLALR